MSEKMSERLQIVSRITSAAIGLALIGAAVYLIAIDRSDHVSTIIAVGGFVLGGIGTAALPSLLSRSSSKPPGRRGPPPLPMLWLFLVPMLLLGCGASAYSTHYRAATVVAGVHAAAGTVIDDARKSALDRVEREHPSDPEHDAELDREADRWRPLGVALDLARDAIGAWIDAVDLARAAGGDEGDLLAPLLALAARAVLLYERIAELAGALGVEDLPPLPPFVRALATSTIGGA